MEFFRWFILPKKDEPKKKAYAWAIREDKVLLEGEVHTLRRFAHVLMTHGMKAKTFYLVRDWFTIELGLNAGLRVEEMAELKTEDLFIVNHHSSVFVNHGKGDRKRTVKISREFRDTCKLFLKLRQDFCLSNAAGNALLSSDTGKFITKRALQKQFKTCIKKANLPEHYSIH